MKYVTMQRRMYGLGTVITPGGGARWGAPAGVEPDGPLVQWFERKQQAAWCELYPHLLEALAAGQRAKRAEGVYRTAADMFYVPDALKEALISAADDCNVLARDCRRLADHLYKVKDYVLGANFGAEGWQYESWCQRNNYPLKSRSQIAQEAERMGLGGAPRRGLGVFPVIPALVIGGVSIAIIVKFITDAVTASKKIEADQALFLQIQERCGQGNKPACEQMTMIVQAKGEAIKDDAKKQDFSGDIASVFKWSALAALGVVAYMAFSKTKYATGPKVEPVA